MRQYRNYTREDVEKYVKEVFCLADLLKKLNLVNAGGNYAHMKRKLFEWKIDCSHWTGQAWNKNQQTKDWSNYLTNGAMKKIIIRERSHKCENCNLSQWQNANIPLELDHIDGDRTNNTKENLKLLCCNCHALTTTWRGRNRKSDNRKPLANCVICGQTVKKSPRKCCSNKCARIFTKNQKENNPGGIRTHNVS